MARLPRLYAPATVQHIVQRPVAGRALFVDAADYALFMNLLQDAVREHAVALHAYVLMPDQIRLLATPPRADSIARLMQAIGRRYVPHLNRKTALGGPLWDRRYRSTLIDADEYLLPAMRYVEHRPVAEALVTEPGDWRWSSYGHHVGREQQAFISDHGHYWALSDAPFERQAAYREIAAAAISVVAAERMENAVERGWVLGGPGFVAALEDTVNRRPQPLQRGRKRVPSPTRRDRSGPI
jgi:putative transposase